MDVDKLKVEYPILDDISNCEEVFWLNDRLGEEKELPFSEKEEKMK